MVKSLIFFMLRGALGFLLITPIFIFLSQQSYVPAETYQDLNNPIFIWLFGGTMKVWVFGIVLSLIPFFISLPKNLRNMLNFAPVYLPLLYAIGTYLWFFQSQIL